MDFNSGFPRVPLRRPRFGLLPRVEYPAARTMNFPARC